MLFFVFAREPVKSLTCRVISPIEGAGIMSPDKGKGGVWKCMNEYVGSAMKAMKSFLRYVTIIITKPDVAGRRRS